MQEIQEDYQKALKKDNFLGVENRDIADNRGFHWTPCKKCL